MSLTRRQSDKGFFKWANPSLFFIYFRPFNTLQFFQQINVTKCPSSTRCRDSNSRPLGHEYPPITTRPGLQPQKSNKVSCKCSSVLAFTTDLVAFPTQQKRMEPSSWWTCRRGNDEGCPGSGKVMMYSTLYRKAEILKSLPRFLTEIHNEMQ